MHELHEVYSKLFALFSLQNYILNKYERRNIENRKPLFMGFFCNKYISSLFVIDSYLQPSTPISCGFSYIKLLTIFYKSFKFCKIKSRVLHNHTINGKNQLLFAISINFSKILTIAKVSRRQYAKRSFLISSNLDLSFSR